MGARSGAGPTHKNFKKVSSNKNRVKLTEYEHWFHWNFQKGIFEIVKGWLVDMVEIVKGIGALFQNI